jgi:hypothetical protein
MQTSTNVSPQDIDDVARAEAEVAARKADLSASLRKAEASSERMVKHLGNELKPALVAGLAVVALTAVAGVTIALVRRRRSSRWLQPERPSALGTAARGAGMFLLRLAARQVATQLMARLDAPPTAANGAARSPVLEPAR